MDEDEINSDLDDPEEEVDAEDEGAGNDGDIVIALYEKVSCGLLEVPVRTGLTLLSARRSSESRTSGGWVRSRRVPELGPHHLSLQVTLKDGIVSVGGKDYLFAKCQGYVPFLPCLRATKVTKCAFQRVRVVTRSSARAVSNHSLRTHFCNPFECTQREALSFSPSSRAILNLRLRLSPPPNITSRPPLPPAGRHGPPHVARGRRARRGLSRGRGASSTSTTTTSRPPDQGLHRNPLSVIHPGQGVLRSSYLAINASGGVGYLEGTPSSVDERCAPGESSGYQGLLEQGWVDSAGHTRSWTTSACEEHLSHGAAACPSNSIDHSSSPPLRPSRPLQRSRQHDNPSHLLKRRGPAAGASPSRPRRPASHQPSSWSCPRRNQRSYSSPHPQHE